MGRTLPTTMPDAPSPCPWPERGARGIGRAPPGGDSENTVRGYFLDIPRFEESLNN